MPVGLSRRAALFRVFSTLALLVPGCADADPTDEESARPFPSRISAVDSQAAFQIGEPCRIELTGTGHRWHARYQSADGRVATTGISSSGQKIHVPLGSDTVIVLKSTDYVYLFAVPKCGLKEIAVPELEFKIEFRPMEAGSFPLVSQRLCGGPPPVSPGELVVESPEKFRTWLHETGLN
jgi:heme/copper-type cytochrome/quinol oxidase subunit 2